MKESIVTINSFYGGIARDDKPKTAGVGSNFEELDIFQSADYVIPEQIMSADTMPATTEIYSYTAGDDDVVYGYGRETAASKVRIVSAASGGATNPGAFGTLFTSSDATNLYTQISPIKFFRTTEASNPTSLYYIHGTGASWYLARYNIGAAAEQRWTGSEWSASGSPDTNCQLTGLTGSFDRPTMKVIYGELFICHNQYIAKCDKDGVFTKLAFTLPKEWEAIDIVPVSDVGLILARNKNRLVNETRCFWWDLTSEMQFNDSYSLPMGGAQWMINYKESIYQFLAQNGIGKFYVSRAWAGDRPVELPGIRMLNIATETSAQPISSSSMIGTKDGILYFDVWKTDKSGIYALGQLDNDKPYALILSKRFATTDYSLHKPHGLLIQGSNYYASFLDNTTESNSRCETLNSPTRSSVAIYESSWIDARAPYNNKTLSDVILMTKKIPASCSFTCYVASDYDDTYTEVKRVDGSVFNTLYGVLARMIGGTIKTNQKAFKVKVAWTSNTTSYASLLAISLNMKIDEKPADI